MSACWISCGCFKNPETLMPHCSRSEQSDGHSEAKRQRIEFLIVKTLGIWTAQATEEADGSYSKRAALT